MLTVVPGAADPRVVSVSVSRETSAANTLPSSRVAVRQAPLTAMLPPTWTSASDTLPASIHSVTSPPRGSTALTLPIPCTMPVNITYLPWFVDAV